MCSLSSVSTITMGSDQDRLIRQLVDLGSDLRIVAGEMRPDTAYARDDAFLEPALMECGFHFMAHRLPCCLPQFGMNAAVCHDLDIAIREQQVDQHAVVVFGVPDA